MRLLPTLLPKTLLLTLAATAPAQNLIQNGDFEASKISIAPWTISGFAQNPAVEEFKTNAIDKSQAYGATINGGSEHSLAQTATLTKGKPYLLRFNVHTTNVGTGYAALYAHAEVLSGTQWTLAERFLVANYYGRALLNRAVVFTPAAAVSKVRLRFTLAGTGRKYRVRIDDFSITDHDDTPWLYFGSNRVLQYYSTNVALDFETRGGPGVANYVFASLKKTPVGVRIPGLKNSFWIDLSFGAPGPLLTIVNNSSGYGKIRVTVPKATLAPLYGVPVFMQPIAFNPIRGIQVIGPAVTLSFEK